MGVLRRAPLMAACLAIAALEVAPAAQAASVEPEFKAGNPKCADFGATALHKFEGEELTTLTRAGVTLQDVDVDKGTFGWSSTVAVDIVIAKGGPNANVYRYPADTFGDSGLVTPTNPNNGKPYGISHVDFCTDGVTETPPSPALEVVKSGPATATVGSQVTWTFAVTNTGDVPLANLAVSDDRCAPLVRAAGETDTTFDPDDTWNYTCTRTVTAADGDAIRNTATACADHGADEVCDEDGHELTIPNPALVLRKSADVDFAYAGDEVVYTFEVENAGNQAFPAAKVLLTDTQCTDDPALQTEDANATLDPEETWTYTCTVTIPADAGATFTNVAEVCIDREGPDDAPCDEDEVTIPVRSIAIDVIKNAVETTAVAGTTVNFTIAVTNTGSTDYATYQFADPTCTTLARTGADADDATLGAGETWTYACAQATAAGDTSAVNTATATGTNADGKSATDTDDGSVPLTAPPTQTTGEQPPAGPTPAPSGEAPGGEVLQESAAAGRARLQGASGCVREAFRARVTGREIASVTFLLDGRRVARITGSRSVYAVKIKPQRLGFGRHRVVARVTFSAGSGTAARTIPLTFRRCAQDTVAPRFTG